MPRPKSTTLVQDAPPGRKVIEDTYVLDDSECLYSVFDGAGAIEPDQSRLPTTGARLAAECIRDHVAKAGVSLSLRQAVIEANNQLDRLHTVHSVPDDKLRRWGTTAAVVHLTDPNIEWLTVGDSVIVVIKKDGSFFLPGGHDYGHDGPALEKLVELSGRYLTLDEKDKILLPIHRATRARANLDYGVLNGEPAAEGFIKTGFFPHDDVSDIIMLTDGLFLPSMNPLEPDDWTRWVNIYRDGGLAKVQRKVRQMEATDPFCRLYPRLKPGDDATAIALRL